MVLLDKNKQKKILRQKILAMIKIKKKSPVEIVRFCFVLEKIAKKENVVASFLHSKVLPSLKSYTKTIIIIPFSEIFYCLFLSV